MSRPIHPSGTSTDVEHAARRSAEKLSAITRSLGSSTLARRGSVAFASARLACSVSCSSHSESPTVWPCALRNGKHIAPPMMTTSATSRKRSITPILSATLAPPTTATSGRGGLSRMPMIVLTSRSSSRPAALGSRCATPSVLACARCAAPNASLTYRSASSASAAASRGSLVVSPGSKRTFSSTRISPCGEGLCHRPDLCADDGGGERHGRVGQLAQPLDDGRQRQVLLAPALGASEVRDEHQPRPARRAGLRSWRARP